MKVSQLIEVLGRMDPEAEIVTHANNHTTNPDSAVTVGVADHYEGKEVVVIGNWRADSFRDRNLVPKGIVWRVRAYGDDPGMLNPYRLEHIPATQDRFRFPVTSESWSFVKIPIDEFC